MYSEKVFEHFMCPQNVGSMPDCDGEGVVGDPNCGDSLTVYIKVKNGVIENISFLVFGCVASIATSSMMTALAKGKRLEDALRITEQDIIDALNDLPEDKKHCSNLGVRGLKAAIQSYLENAEK
jgi:nitrogen fixation NifU-like protein